MRRSLSALLAFTLLSTLQGDTIAAPVAAAGPSVQGNEFGSQHGSAEAATQLQLHPEDQSSTMTHGASHSHGLDAANEQLAPAAESAAGVTPGNEGPGADAAAGQDEWANATGSSGLGALGMTGRSVSSRSGTRRRKVSASV